MEYDRTNTGALFTNDRKTTDKHPDMNGKINIAGVEHWFSGWWKKGQRGDFLSLSIGKPVEEQPQQETRGRPAPVSRPMPGRAPARPAEKTAFDDMPDEIPF